MSERPNLVARFTLFCYRNAVLVLALGFLVLGVCTWQASKLRLQGDFVELLPTESAGGQRFRAAISRMRAAGSTLLVLIESDNVEQNRRFSRRLEEEMKKLPPELVASVEAGPGPARKYFEDNKWLFAPDGDLERIECELEEQRAKALPGYVSLDNPCADMGSTELKQALDPSAKTADPNAKTEPNAKPGATPDPSTKPATNSDAKESPLAAFDRMAQAQIEKRDRFPEGDYRTRDGRLFAVMVRAATAGLGDSRTEQLLQSTQRLSDQVQAELGIQNAKIGFAGDVPNAIAERKALEEDLTIVSSAAVGLVLTSIFVYFFGLAWLRRPRDENTTRARIWRSARSAAQALAALGLQVFVGSSIAFAVANLAYGRLNAATTFLGSIIIGNGINYGIVYIARYHERRAQGDSLMAALSEAGTSCARGTWLASAAASGGYSALMATDFKGFSEFGLIGAVGMFGCWLATFTLCPAAISLFERKSSEATLVEEHTSVAGPLTRWLSTLSHRWPRWVLVISLLATAGFVLRVPGYLKDPWEYDFGKLGSASSRTRGAGQWSSRANELFGTRGSPQLLLADDMSQVLSVSQQVLRADTEHDGPRLVEKVETLYDAIGGTPEVVQKKLDFLTKIRGHIDAISGNLKAEDQAIAARWRPPETLRPLDIKEVPAPLLNRFTEKDGKIGTQVYVTLNPEVSQSRGETLLRLNEMFDKVVIDQNKIVPNAARATVFAEMIRAMGTDGPRASWLSFGLVVLVTAFGTRSFRALFCVLGSLLIALAWLMSCAAWGGLKMNFLNFVAIPLTLGIGVEYAINLYDRIMTEGEHVERGIRSVGGAVILCSLTTILGYGSLLFADNRALVSFGNYAILGEITCIVSALLVMPSLVWLTRKRRQNSAASGATS